MNKVDDYDKIMADHRLFNQVVYTSLTEAIKILKERQKDKGLREKIEKLLGGDIPEPLRKIDKYGISSKQVATPNFDTRWFLNLMKEFSLKPVFLEYYNDKFTSNNSFKHSLGQLIVYDNLNKKGEHKIKKITIVDFNKYNGKPIKDVLTLWSESLIDFHKRLFKVCGYENENLCFYDESNWLKKHGDKAKDYYENDLLLYVYHGILFENFLLTGDDGNFVKNIFLPAFEKVYNLTGLKPLIVPIPPMDIEEDTCWLSYDKRIEPYIKIK